MTYLMEHKEEAKRLLLKSDYQSSKDQLLLTGLAEGMNAVDAGGGAGFVTKIMGEIVGPKGKVTLVDQSPDRLMAAREFTKAPRHIDFIQSQLEAIKLPDHSVDYLFCRFVFEYLRDPENVFKEFMRIVKPGGKIVVGDLDYNCLSHYPMPSSLESRLQQIVQKLAELKIWDAYAGRKIYSYYQKNQLKDVVVHMIPHHLIYGEADTKDIENWKYKTKQLLQMQKDGALQFDFDLEVFDKEFSDFFKNPNRFSYSPLFLVEGVNL